VPDAGRGHGAGGHPRASPARTGKPGGVRAPSQRDHGSGEPVGAWREAPAGRVAEAADAGGEERSRRGRLRFGRTGTFRASGAPEITPRPRRFCSKSGWRPT